MVMIIALVFVLPSICSAQYSVSFDNISDSSITIYIKESHTSQLATIGEQTDELGNFAENSKTELTITINVKERKLSIYAGNNQTVDAGGLCSPFQVSVSDLSDPSPADQYYNDINVNFEVTSEPTENSGYKFENKGKLSLGRTSVGFHAGNYGGTYTIKASATEINQSVDFTVTVNGPEPPSQNPEHTHNAVTHSHDDDKEHTHDAVTHDGESHTGDHHDDADHSGVDHEHTHNAVTHTHDNYVEHTHPAVTHDVTSHTGNHHNTLDHSGVSERVLPPENHTHAAVTHTHDNYVQHTHPAITHSGAAHTGNHHSTLDHSSVATNPPPVEPEPEPDPDPETPNPQPNPPQVNVAPVFREGQSASRSIKENTEEGINIGSPISATDANGDRLTYSLDSYGARRFSVNAGSGQLKTARKLNFEYQEKHVFEMYVTDGSLTDTILVTVNVIDVVTPRADTSMIVRPERYSVYAGLRNSHYEDAIYMKIVRPDADGQYDQEGNLKNKWRV